MSMYDAAAVAAAILGFLALLGVIGGLGIALVAWTSYRADGGKIGLWEYLKGL